ncbi:MAG TPA: DUF881 domain-containing protein, partial [Egibacteraceae bacterium]|nr:DUF881 domain-containing protein [Egibacteraceae bacterium]
MTDTIEPQAPGTVAQPGPGMADRPGRWPQLAVALACALLGFLFVAQVRATERLDERLETEREDDLARILSDLSSQSDRLQSEITELRLTLLAFETSAESEELALRSLQRRVDDLRILAGTVAAEGQGIVLTVDDPSGHVTQELLVDAIQELRDAGAEAIAVNDVRLVVSSAFATRDGRLSVDGEPIAPPYRIVALGAPETMAKALAIPGGAVDSLEADPGVMAGVESFVHLVVPARGPVRPFVFGEPLPPGE